MAETETACVLFIPLDVSGGIFLLVPDKVSSVNGLKGRQAYSSGHRPEFLCSDKCAL